MQERRKEIAYRYEKSREYRMVYCNGAHGGVTPKGEYRFELFAEYMKTPDEVRHMLTGDGLGPETSRSPQSSPITREIMCGVMMTIEGAKSFAQWILDNIRRFEQAKPEQKL